MKYLMTFSYDGTSYNGYQKQPNKNTVQDVLEDVLTRINSNNEVSIVASGRTDSGVHAINQKAHFVLDKEVELSKLKDSINKMLPASIYVKNIKIVNDDFHARFNSKRKTYTYKINTGEYNPLEANYVYQYNKKLDIDKMREAIKYFIGEHDFTSFTKASEDKETYIRTIYEASISEDHSIISITFTGNGFLRYMVRNIVGVLIEIGSNKIKVNDVQDILEKKDRREAGITAPSSGLYLMDVEYENEN